MGISNESWIKTCEHFFVRNSYRNGLTSRCLTTLKYRSIGHLLDSRSKEGQPKLDLI